MKNSKLFIFLISLLYLLTSGCDDETTPEEENPSLEIYYSDTNTSKYLVSSSDTININLADTFSVFFNIIGVIPDSLSLIGSTHLQTEEIGYYEYQAIPTQVGVFAVGAYIYNETIPIYDVFYLNTTSESYKIMTIENPIYNLDIEDDSLKEVIASELIDSCSLKTPAVYTLNPSSLTDGYLEVLTSIGDTLAGTFSTSNIKELTDVTLHYNDLEYTLTFEHTETMSDHHYTIRQDLTEKYRFKHPTATINEVSISTLSVRYKI